MLGISPKNVGISPTRAGVAPKAQAEAQPMSDSKAAQFRDMVCDEVRFRRGIGLKAAFAEVARLFSLTERRVRACWHDELRTVTADEWDLVRKRRIDTLKRRHAHLTRQIALLNLEDDRAPLG